MPKIVTEETKEDIRLEILNVTYKLIRKHGLTHTSIEKITKECNIGKGTFYLYFHSKEELVVALMIKQGHDSMHQFQSILNGREKMNREEGKEYIKYVINRDDSIYRFLPIEYLKKIESQFPEQWDSIQPGHRNETIAILLSHIEGVKQNADVSVVADLMKVCSVAFYNWDNSIVKPSKEEIESNIYNHLFSLIFE